MCIILSCAAGVRPATSTIEECFYMNPDGAGLMYPDGGLVQIRKGFMDLDTYWPLSQTYPRTCPWCCICESGPVAAIRPD